MFLLWDFLIIFEFELLKDLKSFRVFIVDKKAWC